MKQQKQIEFLEGIKAIAEEKNLKVDSVIQALKKGLEAGFKRDLGLKDKDIEIEVEIETEVTKDDSPIKIYKYMHVVETVKDPDVEISLEEANEGITDENEKFKVGDDDYSLEYKPENFGRIASQAVKHILNSGIKEEENNYIYDLYKDSEGEILLGKIQRIAGPTIYITIEPGDVEAVLPKDERVFSERVYRGDKLKFLVKEVENKPKGVLIVLTRKEPNFVLKLFEAEVPEIADGVIKIEKIVRIAGERTKLLVSSNNPDVDPVGTIIGNRGNRIKVVIEEIYNEKIDVLPYSDSIEEVIRNSLAPAKVELIESSENGESVVVVVGDSSIASAIGFQGVNLRLTSELIGRDIDIYKHSDYYEEEGEDEDSKVSENEENTKDNDSVKSSESNEDSEEKNTEAKSDEPDSDEKNAEDESLKSDSAEKQEEEQGEGQDENQNEDKPAEQKDENPENQSTDEDKKEENIENEDTKNDVSEKEEKE